MLEVCNYVSNERKANWRMDVVHRMDEEYKACGVLRSVLTHRGGMAYQKC